VLPEGKASVAEVAVPASSLVCCIILTLCARLRFPPSSKRNPSDKERASRRQGLESRLRYGLIKLKSSSRTDTFPDQMHSAILPTLRHFCLHLTSITGANCREIAEEFTHEKR
jgi:hypothetical protein